MSRGGSAARSSHEASGATGAAMMTSRSAGPCGVARVSRQPERPRSPESFGAQMPCIIRQHMAGVGGRCEPVGEALIGRAVGILTTESGTSVGLDLLSLSFNLLDRLC